MITTTLPPTSSNPRHLSVCLFLGIAAALFWPSSLLAGGTPATGAVTDQLLVANGANISKEIGDFISATNGLDEPYKFFIEVSPDVDRLVVEVFDPDILAALVTTEEANDRDLLRATENSWALYSLFDPSGNRVPIQFGVGDGDSPLAWDNSWITLYDSQNATITTGDTFADNFNSQDYDRNDGTQNWAGDWTEEGETGTAGPTGGILQITGDELSITNLGDPAPFTSNPGIYREVDLSSYTSATLSFDWGSGSGVEDEDSVIVEVSGDGGATYVGLDIINQFDSIAASGSRIYDISAFLASNTRIRFRIFDLFAGANEEFTIDNLEILASTGTSSTSPEDGHWELRMDLSSDVASRPGEQDELNAYGIRAHDGDSSSSGEEVHVYAHSYLTFGLNMNDRTRTYQYYPYITEGCEFDLNDFDFDSGAVDPDGPGGIDAPYGTWDLTSRLTTFTDDEGGTLSANNTWDNTVVTGWTSGNTADDYGIWDLDITISDFEPGNYADIYFGQEDAADPDPTAQPEDDTFRIYFPTDANAAPAKPYFSQRVTHAGLGNGPNPPVMGSVSRFAVTLSITNPSGSIGDITFSNTNLITANVPGDTVNARVRYQGAQIGFPTAGTLVSEPTIGNTTPDDVEWNPGTIAPGNTETLVYFFDLEPLVATDPLTIPVTGTYGSASGSRAVFIDETGAAASTFNFGNLCGLDVISGATTTSTPVLVSSFTGYDAGRGILLEWTTAAEAGTVQYELYRHDRSGRPVKVTEEPLLAMLNASQGGTYRFLDESVNPGERHTYELVELDARGNAQRHGPFPVQAQSIADLPNQLYQSQPHSDTTADRLAAANAEAQSRPFVAPSGRVKIKTGEAGIYRVTAAQLAPLFGLTTRDVSSAIRRHSLKLTHLGQSVAWNRVQGANALEFYAEAINSIYTAENVFFLSLGDGLPMDLVGGAEPPTEWDSTSFRDTLRQEENLRQLVLAPLDPESDIWFWDFVLAGHPQFGTRTFAFDVPAVADTSIAATLAIDLQGSQPGAHSLEVRLNDVFLGEVTLDDLERVHRTLAVDQSSLLPGNNTIELTGNTGGLVFVDGFDLEYERSHQTDNDRLFLHGDANSVVAPVGFQDANVTVFDLNDPQRPKVLQAVRVVDEGDAGYRAIFEIQESEVDYLAVSEHGVFAPLALEVDQPSDLLSHDNRADYLVVTTADLHAPAQRLADYRKARGFHTLVVKLEDIYDEFAHGIADPTMISNFLAYSSKAWKRGPQFVVLAGAGTYDYHNYLGLGGNLIPTRLRSNGATLFATDHPYADFEGADGVPEVMLGRIPALTAAELTAYVDKIIAYEALEEPEWGNEVVLASDNPDAIADFPTESSKYGDLIPVQYNFQTVALPDFANVEAARQTLFDALDSGAVFLNYLGHGGVDRMAAEGLLTSADVPNLTNGERLPVVMAVSCHIGLHGLPHFDSLGEHLVLQPNGGAAAVWAPAWLSEHHQAQFFGDRVLRSVFQNGEKVLGKSVQRALEAGGDLGLAPHLLETYQLLGDPALELRLAPEPLLGGDGCNDSCGEGSEPTGENEENPLP